MKGGFKKLCKCKEFRLVKFIKIFNLCKNDNVIFYFILRWVWYLYFFKYLLSSSFGYKKNEWMNEWMVCYFILGSL